MFSIRVRLLLEVDRIEKMDLKRWTQLVFLKKFTVVGVLRITWLESLPPYSVIDLKVIQFSRFSFKT